MDRRTSDLAVGQVWAAHRPAVLEYMWLWRRRRRSRRGRDDAEYENVDEAWEKARTDIEKAHGVCGHQAWLLIDKVLVLAGSFGYAVAAAHTLASEPPLWRIASVGIGAFLLVEVLLADRWSSNSAIVRGAVLAVSVLLLPLLAFQANEATNPSTGLWVWVANVLAAFGGFVVIYRVGLQLVAQPPATTRLLSLQLQAKGAEFEDAEELADQVVTDTDGASKPLTVGDISEIAEETVTSAQRVRTQVRELSILLATVGAIGFVATVLDDGVASTASPSVGVSITRLGGLLIAFWVLISMYRWWPLTATEKVWMLAVGVAALGVVAILYSSAAVFQEPALLVTLGALALLGIGGVLVTRRL